MGDLTDAGREILADPRSGPFLDELERTDMTKSFKMLTLLTMLDAGSLPGGFAIADLLAGFRRQVRRNPHLRTEVGVDLSDDRALTRYLEANFDHYTRVYEERFEPAAGPLRSVVRTCVEAFLA